MNPYRYSIVKQESACRINFTPMTRFDMLRARLADHWNEVIVPALVLTGCIAALRVALISFR